MKKKQIYVTEPSLPEVEEFIPYLKDIWETKWLTNNGKYHKQLEVDMADYLGVDYISLFTNGTLALITALQALNIKGEVITTPYTFVATANSLIWNNLKPVFVDVDPIYGNLDPDLIEAAITPRTTAILPVHVYGFPANVSRIQEIAQKHKLRVIYDAAHAFGVCLDGESILNHGDLSILSFHATKVYNTMEGGAIISHDAATKQHIDQLKNFGFMNEISVVAHGINSKMNEMQAALGLLQLKYHKSNIDRRADIAELYHTGLSKIAGIRLASSPAGLSNYNYGYYPIFISESIYGQSRDSLYHYLKTQDIIARRYFYPLISQYSAYQEIGAASQLSVPTAEKISKEVICLPIYPELDPEDVLRIIDLIKEYRSH